jgi:hypothetical protein
MRNDRRVRRVQGVARLLGEQALPANENAPGRKQRILL